MIQTGYFARATEKGHKAAWTKVHLVRDGKPLCGYKPHKTMQFQWNSNGVHLPYVECDKCKENIRYQFEVTPYEQLGKTRYYAKFQESPFSISLKDVVKGCDKKFDNEEDAEKWGKRCAKLYRKFWNEVGSDHESIQAEIAKRHKLHELGGEDKVRKQAKKMLFDNMKKQGWHEVLFNEGKPNHSSGLIDSVIDAMMEFKFPKGFHK